MHPNARFREQRNWIEFAVARGFAHIFAATPDGPMVVHAPVARDGEDLAFHLSRANQLADHLDGATVIASISTIDGYISPNWYAVTDNQVPTWNYVAVEIEGVAHALDDAGLLAQIGQLAARHEPRVNPANPWTRDKMDPAVTAKMLRAIRGYRIAVTAIRETVKLSQHKSDTDQAGTVSGLRAVGESALADAMERS